MGDTDRDRSEKAGGSLQGQAASAVSEERSDPLDQVRADPFLPEKGEEGGRFHIVKAPLHVEEESGDFVVEAVEGFNIVLQDKGGIRCGSPRKGLTLKGVYEGAGCRLG